VVPPLRLTTRASPNDPAPSLPNPLRYAGGSQLLRAGPPASPHRYSAPRGFRHLESSLSPPATRPAAVSGHAFTRSVREPGPGSCCLYAGHHLGSKRISPRLIPRLTTGLGFDATCPSFDTSTAENISFIAHLPGPHLTRSL